MMVSKHTDQPSRAGSLSLIGEAIALDFANTSSGRGGPERLDHLREPEHVVAWAGHVGIIAADTAARIRKRLKGRTFAALLADALALREAIYRVAVAIAAGKAPPREDLAAIKSACARAIGAADLAPRSDGFRWTWPVDPPVPETILGPIALSAAGLLREGDLSRIKQCAGEHCGWLFFDLTKNKSRRWCDMAVCGNRMKGRRHRSRLPMRATEEP
jgi:predicted RNA-binding Zn ribbon-like protein